MVSIRSFSASGETTPTVLSRLAADMNGQSAGASLVCAFYDCAHDDALIHDFIREHFPAAAILGGTSCNGAMTEAGLGGSGSIVLLAIDDPGGDYGTAAVRLEGDAAASAEQALHAALASAGCPGELPELIWIYQAPGQEEAVIEGLRRVVGDRCPIIGGSAADNDVSGQWRQLGPDGALRDGLVVGVLFSSGGIGYAFQGGYEPGGDSGIVTAVESGEASMEMRAGRRILTIDGEPAADVYDRWTGGALREKRQAGGNVLADTTMYPLGLDVGRIEGIPQYLLVHPDSILADGSLSTFAAVAEGARLYGMRGEKARLVERAGRVASAAAATLPGGASSLAGGLVVYCGGCMLAVGDEMPKVAQAVTRSFNRMPFAGCFTYGEQGALLDRNVHGNLMISAVAFGK